MTDLVIIGTDTDAGKTTFAVDWLREFADEYEYWKPLQTGEPDTATVQGSVPAAVVHPALASFTQPVAPLLAARREGRRMQTAAEIAAAVPTPRPGRHLLIETFGGPFSPLNDDELQIELLRQLDRPCVLVTSSAVGAVGRALQCLQALAAVDITPIAVALIGDEDTFAAEQIRRHWGGEVWCRPRKTDHDTTTIIARDRRAVWHPYTALADPNDPLVCVGAQDEFLHLADGRRVIDGISSWWTILHGHRHPALMAALHQATQAFDHVHFAGLTHAPAVEMAEALLGTMPWRGGRVFYSDNGSTAVEVALKMAYQFWCHHGEPGRTHFIGFEGGYHGDTFGAMAVGRDPLFFGRFEPLLFAASTVPLDPDRLDAELAARRTTVAAVIVEPLVQGAGGMRMHAPETLRALADVARRHGVLFITDEVMTGNRTGRRWAFEAAGIAPDLVCAGKTLTGGVLPLAATLAAPQVVEAFDTADRARTFFHGHSFTAHPVACAVAVANLKLPLSAPTEAFWREALAPLRDLPQVREVRVCGSIAAVELVAAGGYLADVGRRLRQACLEREVLLRPLGNVLYALPPLGASRDSLERIAESMRSAVRATP
jgi:adenosylmethionine-8-amino-7-oxononanoate aminotransferase